MRSPCRHSCTLAGHRDLVDATAAGCTDAIRFNNDERGWRGSSAQVREVSMSYRVAGTFHEEDVGSLVEMQAPVR